jgi:hypothetical protein
VLKVKKFPDGCISSRQHHLIDIIILDFDFASHTKTLYIPAISSTTLQRDLDGNLFKEHWDFQSKLGKLSFFCSMLLEAKCWLVPSIPFDRWQFKYVCCLDLICFQISQDFPT